MHQEPNFLTQEKNLLICVMVFMMKTDVIT